MSQNHIAYLTPDPAPLAEHDDLAECFEDIKDFELLMRELADFVNGMPERHLREFLEAKLTFLHAEREREGA